MKKLFIKNTPILILILLIMFYSTGCCKKKKTYDTGYKPLKIEKEIVEEKELTVPDESSTVLAKTGLSYSIDRQPNISTSISAPPTFFEREYLDGVKLLEAEDYNSALKKFKDLLKEYPEGEEASIAMLCIAEVFFRTKDNELALKLYQQILEKYPGTQAAQNAKEGINYIMNFSKYESSFVSPDQDHERRRRK